MPHFFAHDNEGNLISAVDAIGGVNYFCPHCHAAMRVRKCITRSPHFFLFDDQHKSRDCGEFEKDRTAIRTPTLLNIKKFAKSVLFPRSRTTCSGGSGGGSGSKPAAHKEILPPNCIRQLIVCGARSMDPKTPIENGILSDVYIGPKVYEKHFIKGVDLDFRVVELWLNSALDGRIRYVANWTYRGQVFRSFLEHHVDDSLNFEEIADELFHKRRDYYGRPLWVKPRYKTIAVGGEWTARDRKYCHKLCNFCKNAQRICRGMWTAPLYHMGQIYYSDLPDNLL